MTFEPSDGCVEFYEVILTEVYDPHISYNKTTNFSEVSFSGLKPGTLHKFTITAINAGNGRSEEEESYFNTPTIDDGKLTKYTALPEGKLM